MLVCPECGNDIPENNIVCRNCGYPVRLIKSQEALGYSASTDSLDLKKGAEQGNPDAMYWLGYCYYLGINGFDNEDEGHEWLQKAANAGHQKAGSQLIEWFGNCENGVEEEYPLRSLLQKYDHLVFVDLETSGLDPDSDQIIELAAIKVSYVAGRLSVVDEMDELVSLRPGNNLSYKITQMTGISEDMLYQQGSSFDSVYNRFKEFLLGDTLLVSYNAQFDLRFLYRFAEHNEGDNILKDISSIDALTVYKDRRDYPHKLENAIEAYGLAERVKNNHRAIDDVYATYEVLKSIYVENDDLLKYVNLYGYNPKYGISGEMLPGVNYVPQPYNSIYKLYETI